MHLSSLRFASLHDSNVLRGLLGQPESDWVERKRTADAYTLAKAVTGFANAEGGWLLLGVDDDGQLPGWQSKGNAHPRDWLRDVLDNEVLEVPAFEADVFDVDGTQVGVVRVPRSVLAPHWLGSGEVWERRNGQTRRASGERIRQLTLRGGGDREAAQARLDSVVSPDVRAALDAPREDLAMPARAMASVLRVSLLDPREAFTDWVHDPEALRVSDAFVQTAAADLNDRSWTTPPAPAPARTTAGGHITTADWDGRHLREVHVAWDKRGIGGVRLAGERPDASGVYYLLSAEARDRWLRVALAYLLDFLEQADAFGPVLVRWDLYGVRDADVTTTRSNSNSVEASGQIPSDHGNAVAVAAEAVVGEVAAEDLAALLWRELERLAGAQRY